MINFTRKYTLTEDEFMARPIKETTILFGEEAKKFEMRMLKPKPVSKERSARIRQDYDLCVIVASIALSK